jgi:hypothetical protein
MHWDIVFGTAIRWVLVYGVLTLVRIWGRTIAREERNWVAWSKGFTVLVVAFAVVFGFTFPVKPLPGYEDSIITMGSRYLGAFVLATVVYTYGFTQDKAGKIARSAA